MEVGTSVMKLLLLDANRIVQYYQLPFLQVESKTQLMRVYELLIKRAGKKKEFPRLYRWAWILMTKAIEQSNWSLLMTIHTIYERMDISNDDFLSNGEFSEWHLKSILYCWLYLPSEGPLDSLVRRSEEGVERLISLVKLSHAFLNLLPKEAEKKLTSVRLNSRQGGGDGQLKPFLFRLSTNDPGIITMTYRTPFSDRLVHRRIHQEEEILMWSDNKGNLYKTLFDIVIRERVSSSIGTEGFMKLLGENMIDPYLNDSTKSVMKKKLDGALEGKSIFLDKDAFTFIEKLFYTKFTQLLVESENNSERLGLTENYLHSYRENSTNNNNNCLSCYKEVSIGAIRESICGRTYCGSYCYGVSFELSY